VRHAMKTGRDGTETDCSRYEWQKPECSVTDGGKVGHALKTGRDGAEADCSRYE